MKYKPVEVSLEGNWTCPDCDEENKTESRDGGVCACANRKCNAVFRVEVNEWYWWDREG